MSRPDLAGIAGRMGGIQPAAPEPEWSRQLFGPLLPGELSVLHSALSRAVRDVIAADAGQDIKEELEDLRLGISRRIRTICGR